MLPLISEIRANFVKLATYKVVPESFPTPSSLDICILNCLQKSLSQSLTDGIASLAGFPRLPRVQGLLDVFCWTHRASQSG